MKHNPDDRSDNVDRIQNNIDRTMDNINKADDMIEETDDEKTRETLETKNERREDSITGLREEIQDEAKDKHNGTNR